MNANEKRQEYVTIPEAARRMNKSRQMVHRYVKLKRVKGARRMGRDWLVPWPLTTLKPDRKTVKRVYG